LQVADWKNPRQLVDRHRSHRTLLFARALAQLQSHAGLCRRRAGPSWLLITGIFHDQRG